jgi:hypothetical protein
MHLAVEEDAANSNSTRHHDGTGYINRNGEGVGGNLPI